MERRWTQHHRTELVSLILLAPISLSSAKADTSVVDRTGQSKMLQSGVTQDAPLNSSVLVVPEDVSNKSKESAPVRIGPGVTQYAGMPPAKADCDSSNKSYKGVSSFGGSVPPLSTYTLTPSTTTTVFPPVGHGSASGMCAPAQSEQFYKGVHEWSAEHRLSRISGSDHVIWSGSGVSVYSPSALAPGGSVVAGSHGGIKCGYGLTSWSVSSTVFRNTTWRCEEVRSIKEQCIPARNGVTIWAPGYEVTVSRTGIRKESVASRFSASGPADTLPSAQIAPLDRIFAQVEPLEQGMQLLPQAEKRWSGCHSWQDWYQAVAKEVYSRWRATDTGAGIATVRLSVNTQRHIRGRVLDYQPIGDSAPSIEEQAEFRESAIRCIDSIRPFDIPPFPFTSAGNEVSFDVEVKRLVDGPSGFSVAAGKQKSAERVAKQ